MAEGELSRSRSESKRVRVSSPSATTSSDLVVVVVEAAVPSDGVGSKGERERGVGQRVGPARSVCSSGVGRPSAPVACAGMRASCAAAGGGATETETDEPRTNVLVFGPVAHCGISIVCREGMAEREQEQE